jgi:hypothetical protein
MNNWKYLETQEFNYTIEGCHTWVHKPRMKDLVDLIAQKAGKTTYGTGLLINTQDKNINDFLPKYIEDNKILEILRKSEYVASKYGKTIMYLSATKNGELILKYLPNPFNGRVSKLNEQEQVAEIWEWQGTGDTKIFKKIAIDNKYITITDYTSKLGSRIGTTIAPEPKDLEPLKEYKWEHNIPFFPVFEIENLPINNWVNTTFNFRPDWLPVWKLIDHYNEAIRISQVELRSNRTRILFEIQREVMSELVKKGTYNLTDIDKDSWINVNTTMNNAMTGGINNPPITLLAGNPQFTSYIDFLNFLEDQIMNGSGYSSQRAAKNNGDYENKTSSLFSDKEDKETSNFKRALRLPVLYKIFDDILIFNGIEPFKDNTRLYTIDISDILISDLTLQADTFEKWIDNGVMSRAEVRSLINNIPVIQAQKEIKMIEAEQLAYINKFNTNPNSDTNNSNTNQITPSNDLIGGN